MNKRRKLIIALGAGALVAPLLTFSQQQNKVRRIGMLYPGSQTESRELGGVFLKRLRDLGYVEGGDVVIEWRYADGKTEPLPALAAELVKLNVDVIVTQGTPLVRASRQATATIPIITTSFANPVASGFAVSLARPGGNITGFANLGEEIFGKRLEMLISVAPKAKRIAWLTNPNNAAVLRVGASFEPAARKMGKTIVRVDARGGGELREAFSRMTRERVGAIIVSSDGVLNRLGTQIADFALRHRLPSTFGRPEIVEAGGLMSYGEDYTERYRRAAVYVDKIFKGAKAGDLPIEQPTEFELVINMKTAKALGLKIPQSILVQATKVIE